MDLNHVFKLLKDSSRFYLYEHKSFTLIYDCYINKFYQINTKSFKIIQNAILNNKEFSNNIRINYEIHEILKKFSQIVATQEILPMINENSENNIQVMINTGTTCNLDCTYCYRNKQSNIKKSASQIENEIEYVISNFTKDEYVFSLSMTSESSLDYSEISKIINKYYSKDYYIFHETDIKDVASLIRFLKLNHFPYLHKLDKGILEYLNTLLKDSKLINKINIPDNIREENNKKIAPFNITKEEWTYFRMNRYILNKILSPFLYNRKIPIITFWFMSNGINLSKDYITLVKKCNIKPFWISIDGCKTKNDINRKFSSSNLGSYNYIYKTIHKLKKNHISLHASSVLNIHNYYPLEIAKITKKLGFGEISMALIHSSSHVSFDKTSILKLLHGYDILFNKLISDINKKKYDLLKYLKNDLSISFLKIILCNKNVILRCSYHKQLVIDNNGYFYNCLYFCDNTNFSIRNISDYSKTSPESFVFNRSPCNSCWARFLCGGTCFYNSYYTNGDINSIDEVECILRKYLIKKNIELFGYIWEKKLDNKIKNIIL